MPNIAGLVFCAESPDFKAAADSVFQTLLTITTILSGAYTAITFNWYSQYMVTPRDPRMLKLATLGNILALMFILPLVIILVSWAFSKLRDSITWRTMSWTGLIYSLTQDFIGIIAIFTASLTMTEMVHHTIVELALPLVIVTPPLVAGFLGYRVSTGYSRSMIASPKKRRRGLAVFAALALVLGIQVVLGLLLLYLGAFFST